MRWEGRVVLMRSKINVYKTLVGSEMKISLGIFRRRWDDNNIKTILKNIRWERADWIHLA
jgi:hypothetical protein